MFEPRQPKRLYLITPETIGKDLSALSRCRQVTFTEFEAICESPPEKYQGEPWIGLYYYAGDKHGLIDKRYR